MRTIIGGLVVSVVCTVLPRIADLITIGSFLRTDLTAPSCEMAEREESALKLTETEGRRTVEWRRTRDVLRR